MGLAQLGTEIFLLFVAGALATIATLVWEFVIGAAADERTQNSQAIDALEERMKAAEQSCAKAERLSSRVDENERRSKETKAEFEELMRYLLGSDQPGDEGAIRGMHNSIEDVRGDVRDLREQNEKIEHEVRSIGRTSTDIAYSFHEVVDVLRQMDGVDAPTISLREDFRERDRGDDHRPDGGVGSREEFGPHEEGADAYDWLDELKGRQDDTDDELETDTESGSEDGSSDDGR